MTHKRSGSVADIASMFETAIAAKKQQPKPLQKVMARRHSMSKMWENKFKTKQPELVNGPRKACKPYHECNAINDNKKPKKEDSHSIKPYTHTPSVQYEFDDNVIDITYKPEIYASALNESYKAKIATLETEFKQHENNYAELNDKYDNLSEENNGLLQEFESRKTQIGELGTEIERLNKSIADNETLYEKEKEALNIKVEQYNELFGEKEEVTGLSTSTLQFGESDMEIRTVQLGNDEVEIANLRKENAELSQMLNDLQKSKIDLAIRTDEEMQKLRRMVWVTSQIYGERSKDTKK